MVHFDKEDEDERVFAIEINKADKCFRIKSAILKQIFKLEENEMDKYKLLFRNKILEDQKIIRDANLKDNDRVHLTYDPA
mmetsp:Transcript_33964/g.30722  ORF Transcript_33964/g.30722 Transcript_33964/m.30722 type:complete len:80 (+) Transcript_33964:684-923(+)